MSISRDQSSWSKAWIGVPGADENHPDAIGADDLRVGEVRDDLRDRPARRRRRPAQVLGARVRRSARRCAPAWSRGPTSGSLSRGQRQHPGGSTPGTSHSRGSPCSRLKYFFHGPTCRPNERVSRREICATCAMSCVAQQASSCSSVTGPNSGMLAEQPQVRRRQVEGLELLQVGAPQLAELSDQRLRRPPAVARESPFAIERHEPAAARQDPLDPRHPVGDLAVRDMTQHLDDVPGAVGLAPRQRLLRRRRDQSLDDPRPCASDWRTDSMLHHVSVFRASIGSIRRIGSAAISAAARPASEQRRRRPAKTARPRRARPRTDTLRSAGAAASAPAAPAASPSDDAAAPRRPRWSADSASARAPSADANRDLPAPQRDRERRHRVDPGAGQQQRERPQTRAPARGSCRLGASAISSASSIVRIADAGTSGSTSRSARRNASLSAAGIAGRAQAPVHVVVQLLHRRSPAPAGSGE